VTERAGIPFRKIFLRRTQAGKEYRNFFSSHRYSQQLLLSYRLSGRSMSFGTYFSFRKKTLIIIAEYVALTF
jgi:hypothetical protein